LLESGTSSRDYGALVYVLKITLINDRSITSDKQQWRVRLDAFDKPGNGVSEAGAVCDCCDS
jgi:hypothetical protein